MPRDGYPSTIVAPAVLKSLEIVPRLAAEHGRGFTLLDGEALRYYPITELARIPAHFARTIASYDPRSEVLLINDRNLDRCSWMLVRLKAQSDHVWENSITERRKVKL